MIKFIYGYDLIDKFFWKLKFNKIDLIAYCRFCFHSDIDLINYIIGG